MSLTKEKVQVSTIWQIQFQTICQERSRALFLFWRDKVTYFQAVFVSSKSLFLTLCGSVITLTPPMPSMTPGDACSRHKEPTLQIDLTDLISELRSHHPQHPAMSSNCPIKAASWPSHWLTTPTTGVRVIQSDWVTLSQCHPRIIHHRPRHPLTSVKSNPDKRRDFHTSHCGPTSAPGLFKPDQT